MRTIFTMAVVMASLSACGGGSDNEDSVSVFKSNGAVQCTGGGVTLATLEGQLTAGKVQVRASACGNDGLVYAAVCGAPDGRIGIFQIPSDQVAAAAAVGFAPLSTAPGAKVVPCL